MIFQISLRFVFDLLRCTGTRRKMSAINFFFLLMKLYPVLKTKIIKIQNIKDWEKKGNAIRVF